MCVYVCAPRVETPRTSQLRLDPRPARPCATRAAGATVTKSAFSTEESPFSREESSFPREEPLHSIEESSFAC